VATPVTLNPFSLFVRIVIAGLKIAAYLVIFCVQIPLYVISLQARRIPDALGEFCRNSVNALAAVFE